MFRYLLAAYMLLLSLTGPSPCCCTVARLVATVFSTGSGEASCQRLTCCGRQPTRVAKIQQVTATLSGGRNLPDQSGRHCQCVKSFCTGALEQKLELIVSSSILWSDHLSLDLIFTAERSPEPSFAVRSGREVCVALCSWRC